MKFGARQISPKNVNEKRRRQIRNSFFVIRSSDLDLISLLVTCSADIPLKQLEKSLAIQGYTLGYRPITKKSMTLLQALEKRVPNRLSPRYGGIEDICVSIRVIRKGQIIATRNVPRAATGPDFKKIFIGSRGRYGKIIEATLRVRHA